MDATTQVLEILRKVVTLTEKNTIKWEMRNVIENGFVLEGTLFPYTFVLTVQIVPVMSKVLVAQTEKQGVPPLSLTQIFYFTVKETDSTGRERVIIHHTVDPSTVGDPITSTIRDLYTIVNKKINDEIVFLVKKLRDTLNEYLK